MFLFMVRVRPWSTLFPYTTLFRSLTLEARGDLECGERAPVVEFDTFAQGERPDQAVAGDVPPGGQRRLDLGASLAPGHERVEDLAGDEWARAFEGRARIERGGHSGSADPQLAADDLGRRHALAERRCRHRKLLRDQERHNERHERSQNGSDATEHRRGHHRLYTWNPLFTPLVSRAGSTTTSRYRTCCRSQVRAVGTVTEWRGATPMGKNTENSTCQPAVSNLPTLTFFFAAAYTSSTRRKLVHERRTGGQVRRDGL